MISKLLREPLLHFFVLGAALFVLFGWMNDGAANSGSEIVVGSDTLDSLASTFEKTWQRPPTDDELQGLLAAWIREEVLYREGVAIGFDRDDVVIRRRVAQKMSFVADGMVPTVPDDSELQQWLEANAENYRFAPRYTLRQVYFNPAGHVGQLDAVLADAKAELESVSGGDLPGDLTMLPGQVNNASTVDLERVFGREFVAAIAELDVGGWQGPFRSGFGVHFAEILEFVAGRDATLAEVREQVERDLLRQRSDEIAESFYESLRSRYTIRIEHAAAE